MSELSVLQTYLQDNPHHHKYRETWPIQGDMLVRLSIAHTLPPADVSSSILAIVFDQENRVVFLAPQNMSGNIWHVLIGGRAEADETPEQTIVREVGEETGWCVEPIRMVGFRHFCHLGAEAEGNDRPYPDFIQPIFAALAHSHDRHLVLQEDHIQWCTLAYVEAEEATESGARLLLKAAADAVQEALSDLTMAQPYLDQLQELASNVDGRQDLKCKHFFSGAALYVERKICATLTPKGLAFKLPKTRCDELFKQGNAVPLRYFDHSPIKHGYVLFPDLHAIRDTDMSSLFDECIAYVTSTVLRPIMSVAPWLRRPSPGRTSP